MKITDKEIKIAQASNSLRNKRSGAYVSFEGWIRDHNEGRHVRRLEYEVYEPIAIKEGKNIIDEAKKKFDIHHASCIHRSGLLDIGECAVWVGVSSSHRKDAFEACKFIIDEVKIMLPIWKKEYYENGDSGWGNCETCSSS